MYEKPEYHKIPFGVVNSHQKLTHFDSFSGLSNFEGGVTVRDSASGSTKLDTHTHIHTQRPANKERKIPKLCVYNYIYQLYPQGAEPQSFCFLSIILSLA